MFYALQMNDIVIYSVLDEPGSSRIVILDHNNS